jgi:putative ABC transport system permease protein
MKGPARPPRLARWLAERAVPRDMRDDVSGDLIELFHHDRAAAGAMRAAARYWRNAVSCSLRFGAERCRSALDGGVMANESSSSGVRGPLQTLAGWRMDLALGVRMLLRYPALSAIAVFGIAVGIALAATMFTIVGEQQNPSALPLPDGDRIVVLQKWDAASHQLEPIAPEDVRTWRERLSSVHAVGAFRTVTRNLVIPSASPEPVAIAEISGVGFQVASIAPLMGRALTPEDERVGATPVVVIGYGEWQRRFGGRHDVLDTTVQLGGTHHTVIGVMPEGFAFPIQHAYWTPLRLDAAGRAEAAGPAMTVFARLADGATPETATAEFAALAEASRQPSSGARQELRHWVVPYANQFSAMQPPGNRFAMQMVRFFIAVLLAVVSINIAVLIYARTAARQAEIAVRSALGASRARIVAQLFGEGLVLAGAGALAGLTVAAVAFGYIREAFAQEEPLPFWMRFSVTGETIAYVVVLTLGVAALIGALPAWKATGPRVQNQLQALTAGGGSGMHLGRVWTALILLQVAFGVALLPMVLVRMSQLVRDGTQPFGFAADEYVVAQLVMEATPGPEPERSAAPGQLASRYREIERRVTGSGAVHGTTFSSFAPGFEMTAPVRSETAGSDTIARVNAVAVNFFDTFKVQILTGRNFTTADTTPDSRVVVVNRTFATIVPNGGAVLGSRIRPAADAGVIPGLADDWYQVVGIVEDFPAPMSGRGLPEPKVYSVLTPEAVDALTAALHVPPADAQVWGARLRQIAAEVDPRLQVNNVMPMGDLLRQNQRSMRQIAAVFAAMTLTVLLLSAAGIYAMMAFSVTQRRREIGIRLALGAGARRILWTMFSRAGVQLLAGAVLGTAVALILDASTGGELMSGQAALATGSVVLLMTVVGLLAALGPARQGLRIQPTEALRDPSR